MNLTSNDTSSSTSHPDPWVESGALVYVAMTVAVCAAIIMCCTWFLTSNETTKALWNKYCQKTKKYNELNHDDEEEIELRPNGSPQDSEEEYRDNQDIDGEFKEGEISSVGKDVFTLEDSDEEEEIPVEAV